MSSRRWEQEAKPELGRPSILSGGRTGHVSAAAEQFGTEHTVVARHIQALEDELDSRHRDGSHRRTQWLWERLSGATRAGTHHPKLEIEIIASAKLFGLLKREADIAIGQSSPAQIRFASRCLTDFRMYV